MEYFDDIRPFHDSEVVPTLQRLANDELFLKNAEHFLFGENALSGVELVQKMRDLIVGVDSIAKVQVYVADYVAGVIDRTTDGFSYSGVEALDLNQAHLFIGNHRDIALDSALINYCLHRQGVKTARIAAGDNLKTVAGITDLMRLNKTFFVRRSVTGAKALVRALNQLSGYIKKSILEDKEPVWIAQRDGRAKDGNDATSPAVLKMLAMSREKTQSFKAHFDELKIIPVCLSYEFDPCDGHKAEELLAQERGGYVKKEHEDIFSMAKGLTKYKGRVHLNFGSPIKESYNNANELAALIDEQIFQGYRFFPSNICAYEALYGSLNAIYECRDLKGVTDAEREKFRLRLAGYSDDIKHRILLMYAAPVKNFLAVKEAQIASVKA